MAKVKGTDTDGKVVTLEKCQPRQLSLFRTFVPDDGKYSNTIELYDAIPKYFASTKEMEAKRMIGRDKATGRVKGEYLQVLERQFKHKGENYTVSITPARIKDQDGNEKEYYPTEREELVEEALKKIASDQLNGVYLDNFAGVQFTLYELRQELKRRGHSIHIRNLIAALTICARCKIDLKNGDGSLLSSSVFPTLLMTNRDRWLENPKSARCYVQFNPLVTQSVNHLTYRQFDYGKFMEHRRQLTRWLHKRLSHNYLQAAYTNTYSIKMSTIIRDSALVNAKRINDNTRQIEATLEELHEKEVITSFTKEVVRTERNKIKDVTYCLTPHYSFVEEMKKANKRNLVIWGLNWT